MLGNFQQTHLRIEVDAKATVIRDSLIRPAQLRQWLWPQQLPVDLPEQFVSGLKFTGSIGPLSINYQVHRADSDCLCLLLSQGIDGFHEWHWGDGWVQSRLEGISLIPLSLGQTLSLLSLRRFLQMQK